jgi:hypothetical protein
MHGAGPKEGRDGGWGTGDGATIQARVYSRDVQGISLRVRGAIVHQLPIALCWAGSDK